MTDAPPATGLNYDMLAIDLDGTLLDPDGHVSPRVADALRRARHAGLMIVPATGRGIIESGRVLRDAALDTPAAGTDIAPVVVAGGSMIADAVTRQSLHHWAMDAALVRDLCDLFKSFERAPLLLKDRTSAGYDYLVVESGPIEPPTKWWFSVMDVGVRYVADVREDPHPEHTIRLGFAAHVDVMYELAQSVRAGFGDRTLLHHFALLKDPEDGTRASARDDSIHLLEVFDPHVSKWTALHRLALERRIPRERIAAIGDEINDVAMIEGAALGIAMGNAVEAVRTVADVRAPSNADDGVAFAIDRILAGEW
ncbi:MAG: HAD hydrolase family protein [Planctomycetota bacterium]